MKRPGLGGNGGQGGKTVSAGEERCEWANSVGFAWNIILGMKGKKMRDGGWLVEFLDISDPRSSPFPGETWPWNQAWDNFHSPGNLTSSWANGRM